MLLASIGNLNNTYIYVKDRLDSRCPTGIFGVSFTRSMLYKEMFKSKFLTLSQKHSTESIH